MQNLAKHPLIKIIGIALILYYGLLHNKEHPDSLGNRLSTDHIKNNISDASEKSAYIITNIKKLEEEQKNKRNLTP